ncbi:DegT/DnrJ/EryC1/StrS aminotransferase family protein [Marinimicrobium sp. ABcell2]|uniref:DegT/DnrJ/EryC1/StrS family aminotransferase n=1 Tax=Marinimicrobium sp. ABcell2 TaxID=3069751 RepID=UPI0027B7FF05|nr:DegT/DnrJ/EryC1/StrS family aminotransferase [Marinimicrobium sp. ABcell2]MDQ2078146.1 DegT/DnrJ/EryC1/StrS family aminotransferase [Marinimicrobium sp. ABcell2]
MVPLFDPHPQHARVRTEVVQAVNEVLDSGQFIMGPNVQNFEDEAAVYHGVKHAIGVASGTDALLLALLAAGVGEGDEVITSPFTFIATLEAIYQCGATAVFADIDPATMNLDPDATASVVTERTRAVLPVHLFGQAADMKPFLELGQKHNLRVIGDCAQAFGARYHGTSVGALGDAGCFSFFPTKNLGGYGDGGLITTDSDELADAVRVLRNHGSRTRYYHDVVGYNSRLDEVQAAALRIKLRHLEEFNESRRAVAAIYDQELSKLGIRTPKILDGCHHVYGQYTILLSERDRLRDALQQRDIGSAIYYPVPLHRQSVCRDTFQELSFPVCEQVAEECLSLPMFPGMTEAQAREVVAAVAEVL